MKKSTQTLLFFLLISFSLAGQPSPFGTGQITNQNIGQLEDVSVIVPSESGYGFGNFFPDAQEILEEYNFDIYVPEDYDGTEAYGLVTFINSGNNGGFKSQWLSVLDDKKLIWIAGDNIGNPIFINIRMGVGMAGALRMQELFNIDTDRIFTSGNSGGARMAHNLAFIYPETFRGAMPSCGGSYIREVEQDYETQDPDSHYESIVSYPADYLNYLRPFDQRFANMTSFNDFREGDIMNIYHNGSEQDGLKAKFLETSGGHCSTTTEHFLDAVNFVEHQFLDVIQEDFDGLTSPPFIAVNAALGNGSDMELVHSTSTFAQIKSSDLFLWDDPMGAILETSVQLDPNDFNSNASFNLGVWSMENPLSYCGFVGTQLSDGIPGILLTLDFVDAQPILSVKVENPAQPDLEVLFTSTFTDWNVNEPLSIKYHLWDKELRIELGGHLLAPATDVLGVRLLDDLRSIRIRWNEVTDNFWENTAWGNGAFLTLSSEKKEAGQSASNIFIDRVELMTENVNVAAEVPTSSSAIEAFICQGENYLFNNENLSAAGIYNITLTNAQGCDSLVSLSLTVNPLPLVDIEEGDGVITASSGFQSYQWYFDGVALNNETEPIVIPNENGDYYVEITDENGCGNTSNIVSFISTAIEMISSANINIHPNPTSGDLMINTNGADFKAEIFDLQGRCVATNLNGSNDISHLVNGIYLLIIQQEESTFVYKIQKLD